MGKQASVVLSVLLLFAGVSSAAIVTRSLKPSRHLAAAIQQEKRLGPKPTPRWYWRWVEWRLGEGYAKGHAHEAALRPTRAPHRVPRWAWERLHYFVLARSERRLAGRKDHGSHTTTSTTTTTTTTTTTPTPASGGTPGDGVLEYGGHLTSVASPDLYSMVIGSAWSSDATSVVSKTAGRGLVYFNGAVVQTTWSTGVTYSEAAANGWLLTNSSGNYMTSPYGAYAADIGSAAYQKAWITNVLNYLAARPGIDGIFIDTVVMDPKASFGGYPALYPSTAAYSAAMVSFVQAVYAALHAKGYYVALNGCAYKSGDSTYSDGTSTIDWWKRLGPYADGLMDEDYAETSSDTLRATGTAWSQQWDGWQRLIGVAQSMGTDFVGLEYNSATDTAAMTYGKASFLLEWNGGRSEFIYKNGSTDPTNGAWTTDIGTPTAQKVQVGVGWERDFTGGTVLVNPSPSVSQTFTVNGTTYTLAPTTARILANS
jgi:hypothetical protein